MLPEMFSLRPEACFIGISDERVVSVAGSLPSKEFCEEAGTVAICHYVSWY